MLIFFEGSFGSHVVKAAEIIIMPFCLSFTNCVKYIFKSNENPRFIGENVGSVENVMFHIKQER